MSPVRHRNRTRVRAALTVLGVVGVAWALSQAASAAAGTITPMWVSANLDAGARPTSAQLAPFNNAAGWTFQRAAGPVWWEYTKGTRTSEAGLPESWYIHVDGVRVRDKARPGLFVMDPSNSGWREHVASGCKTGRCFLDGVGSAGLRRTTLPITDRWTVAEWTNAIAGLVRVAAARNEVLPNSAFTVDAVRQYTAAAGRVSTEGFSGLGDLRLLRAGRVWVVAKTRISGGCGHVLAAYLIGKARGDHFACSNLSNEPWDVPRDLRGPRIGKPLERAQRTAHGWKRRFRHGVVIAHSDGTWRIAR